MRRIPKIKIPASFFEKDGDVDALPQLDGASPRRLDPAALTIDAQPQRNPMLSFFVSAAVASGVFVAVLYAASVSDGFLDRIDGGLAFLWWVLTIIMLGLVLVLSYFIYIGFLQSSPSPIVFDRKRRKVYGSHRGVAFEMDWARVGPAIVSAPMVMKGGGYMTLYNLNLVQYAEGKPREAASIERGIQLSAGNAGTIGCMGLWEFIRCYMDEDPARLPPTEVQPVAGDWTERWLERGVYGGFYAGHPMIAHLREHGGVPPLHPGVALLMFVCAPGLLLSYYDAWLRPQTRLDPAWIPPVPSEANPYRIITPTQEDRALREKAARLVAVWSVLLIGGGCACYAALVWWLMR